MANGYCVKCKAKRDMNDPKEITMKNGRPATQGICPECGTKMFKIGKAEQLKDLREIFSRTTPNRMARGCLF